MLYYSRKIKSNSGWRTDIIKFSMQPGAVSGYSGLPPFVPIQWEKITVALAAIIHAWIVFCQARAMPGCLQNSMGGIFLKSGGSGPRHAHRRRRRVHGRMRTWQNL